MTSDIARTPSLDDWYRKVNSVYLDRNFYKSDAVIFMHLVEVMGGLSLLASDKRKVGVEPQSYVPKAIAWWLALCGKVGVRSVEDMIWWKFPGVCTYCRRPVHQEVDCKRLKRADRGPRWDVLEEIGRKAEDDGTRPHSLMEWQQMFSRIYPASGSEQYPATFARFTEELGELAESVRVFPLAPGYFLSEAADVFAWLMHLQNLIEAKNADQEVTTIDLETAFAMQYPNGCRDCGHRVCICPPILMTSLGRIAHEAPSKRRGFSAALLTTDEAIQAFEVGTTLTVNGETVPVTPELIQQLNDGITQLLKLTIAAKESDATQTGVLLEALDRLRQLTTAQRVTQETLDGVAEAIRNLPEPQRSRVMEFLQGASEGVWATVLVDLVQHLAR